MYNTNINEPDIVFLISIVSLSALNITRVHQFHAIFNTRIKAFKYEHPIKHGGFCWSIFVLNSKWS